MLTRASAQTSSTATWYRPLSRPISATFKAVSHRDLKSSVLRRCQWKALILVLIAVVVIVILTTVGHRVNNVFSNISHGLST